METIQILLDQELLQSTRRARGDVRLYEFASPVQRAALLRQLRLTNL